MNEFRAVETINLANVHTMVNPEHDPPSLHSPATLFMTDFLNSHPVVVSDVTDVDTALRIMKEGHVRLLLVEHGDEFVGVVSAADITGGKVLAYMGSNQVHDRSEVLVRHIMINRDHIHGLDYARVAQSSIGDVLQTIRHLDEQHVLVVESKGADYVIRGLFSTTNLVRALGINVDIGIRATTFFELEQVISGKLRGREAPMQQ